MLIRLEHLDDIDGLRRVHETAFPTPAEARLVDLLREHGKATISLVGEMDGTIVGHILFSPVTIESAPEVQGLGLGPVAVLPAHQRCGIGSRLIREGLDACRRLGCPFVVVLGAPAYYQRFGFTRAGTWGLTNDYGVDEPFMAIQLRPGAIPAAGGRVVYAPEFADAAP